MTDESAADRKAVARSMAEADPTFGSLNRLLNILREEDDRGLVLVSAAFAEDCLGRLIARFLLDNKSAAALLDGFNAPLGTLASRTKAAHALGLLSDPQFADLEKLRSIRNDLAHTWEPVSLSTPSIADRIRAMAPSRIPSSTKSPDRAEGGAGRMRRLHPDRDRGADSQRPSSEVQRHAPEPHAAAAIVPHFGAEATAAFTAPGAWSSRLG